MTPHNPSTRRDRRYPLRPGSAIFEFTDPRSPTSLLQVPLAMISVAGIEIRVPKDVAAPPMGCILESVTLRIGNCVLQGEAVVRSSRSSSNGDRELGCLFYPGSPEFEERLVVLLAGVDAGWPNAESPE